MSATKFHRITACTICRHTGLACTAGFDLIARLSAAVKQAGASVGADLALSGSAQMTGCNRICTIGWHATADDLWFFGDIGPDGDPESLARAAVTEMPSHIAAVGRIQAVEARLH